MSSTYHDDVFERFVKFCEKYDGDLYSPESEFYRNWYKDMNENCQLSEQNVIRMLKIFPDFQLHPRSTTNKTFVKFVEFVETNQRLPKYCDGTIFQYYTRIRREREKLNVINRAKFEELLLTCVKSKSKQIKISRIDINHNKLLEFKQFCDENKRLPKYNSTDQVEKKLRSWHHNVLNSCNLYESDALELRVVYNKYRERRAGRIAN
jgi:hypothetical protein